MKKTRERNNVVSMLNGFTGDILCVLDSNPPFTLKMTWWTSMNGATSQKL
jgi:hypothetical protein